MNLHVFEATLACGTRLCGKVKVHKVDLDWFVESGFTSFGRYETITIGLMRLFILVLWYCSLLLVQIKGRSTLDVSILERLSSSNLVVKLDDAV